MCYRGDHAQAKHGLDAQITAVSYDQGTQPNTRGNCTDHWRYLLSSEIKPERRSIHH
jgi:hypothetical protein